jgi:aspartyl-tRNA(Asn)/glutamyl-tRNA(Gln) amidotransferase subunit A
MRVSPRVSVDERTLLEPLHSIAARLDRKELSSEELVRAVIARTEALEPRLNSYITFLPEQALEQARKRDLARARGDVKGPLHGVPVSLKDVFDTAGIPTTAGARFLSGRKPSADAEAARRLFEAGAVLMGKSNLNKFAGGESGENPDFGDIKNPWNTDYSPSGSSGGSAVQVATGMAALSLGSDNGGSVRNPACVCGIVGLKPTHGRISAEGMFPRAYSVDHAGTLTRTVRDAALVLGVLAGHREGDGTAARRDVPDYLAELDRPSRPIRGLRIGVDRELARVGEAPVLRVFGDVLSKLEEIGCSLVDVSLPTPEEMMPVMYTIFFCEWGVAHERWMHEHPEEYDGGSRAALLIPAADYLKAQQQRRVIQRRFAQAMKDNDVDLLVSPTYPLARREHRALPIVDGRRFTLDDALRYTMPYDLMGLPAVSIPGGFASDDAPVGFQLAGRAFEEALVLAAAHAYESATPWHERHPSI